MPTLLRIDSSPNSGKSSVSRTLTDEFVQHWQEIHPDGKVNVRDLSQTQIPLVTAEWIAAAYTPEASRTPRQTEILATSDELIAELQEAGEYVAGVPMFNFGIPAVMKLWIDQVSRTGKTFTYEGGSPKGLLIGKKATFVVASGGVYDQGTPAGAMDFTGPYLRSVFGFLGVSDIALINAGGTAKLRFGSDPATVLQPARTAIRSQFVQAA